MIQAAESFAVHKPRPHGFRGNPTKIRHGGPEILGNVGGAGAEGLIVLGQDASTQSAAGLKHGHVMRHGFANDAESAMVA